MHSFQTSKPKRSFGCCQQSNPNSKHGWCWRHGNEAEQNPVANAMPLPFKRKASQTPPSAQISQVHFCGAFLSCQARKIQKQPVLITRKCASSTHFGNGPSNACTARRFGAPSGRRFCRCRTSITLTFYVFVCDCRRNIVVATT